MSDRPHDSRRNGSDRDDRASPSKVRSSEDALDMLTRRTYATYLTRLRTANRTRLRGQLWNLPLVTSPVVTLIVAVVSLSAPQVYSDRTDLLLVVLTVLTLVASIIVPSAAWLAQKPGSGARLTRVPRDSRPHAKPLRGGLLGCRSFSERQPARGRCRSREDPVQRSYTTRRELVFDGPTCRTRGCVAAALGSCNRMDVR